MATMAPADMPNARSKVKAGKVCANNVTVGMRPHQALCRSRTLTVAAENIVNVGE